MNLKHLLMVGTIFASLGIGSVASAATSYSVTTAPQIATSQLGMESPQSHMHHSHHKMGWYDDAAKVLKTDKTSLIKELKSGKSLADIAKEKGMSTSDLKSGLTAAQEMRLEQAVKSGKLTAEKKQAILSHSSKHMDKFINHKGLLKRGHFGSGKHFKKFWLEEAAKVLNTDKETLIRELKSGKSLADVAKEKGVSTTKLKSSLQAAQKAKLDQAVKSGKLTQAEEQKILSKTSKHIDQWINRKGMGHHH